MEKYCRKFIISDEHFSGFGVDVDITQTDKLDDIVQSVKLKLLEVLKEHNFENLIILFQKKEFHIHSVSMERILTSDKDELFYVCHH